jgi:formylglycine-generating enzyme required for sulfatase activity
VTATARRWGHGAFFHTVLEGLGGKADLDGDGDVDFDELSRYVRKQVPARVKAVKGVEVEQEPNFVGNLTGLVPLARVELPQTLTAKTVKMEFVLVPAGTFLMGSPKSDTHAFDNEKPQHQVMITQPFYLGKYTVTVGQFKTFVQDVGYRTDAEKDGRGGWGFNEDTGKFEQKPAYTWRNPGFTQGPDYPVVNVSWNDAVAFCKWLSKREGRTFQLPTEAQWEYACRGKSTRIYVTGDDVEALKGFANVADASFKRKFPSGKAAEFDDGNVFTAPVGSFRSNDFGLCDMIGNVWQCCLDGPRQYESESVKDPIGPKNGGGGPVWRGGSWVDDEGRVWGGDSRLGPAKHCRPARRLPGLETIRDCEGGFRVLALAKAPK